MSRLRTIGLMLGAIAVALYVVTTLARSDVVDFAAFYCGGSAVAASADPYRTEPLRGCEHRNSQWTARGARYVIPDPLPPYDQGLFALGSHVGFGTLRAIWLLALFAAFAATVALLVRVTGLPLPTIAAALFVADFYCSSLLGQLPPLCIFGIALAGWGMLRDRRLAVALGLIVAMVEPHIGAPALVAVVFFGGKARVSACAAALFLVAVSAAAMPFAEIVEYFTKVIPAHAISEINAEGQYGVSYQLHALGLSESASVAAGRSTYLLALAAGLLLAYRARDVFGRAAIVFVPCAVILIGTPFLHLTQMACAIPAALLVSSKLRSRIAGCAVSLLSVPWMDFSNTLRMFPIVAASLYAMLRRLALVPRRAAIWLVIAAMVFLVLAADYESAHEIGDVFHYGAVLPSDLPETIWKTISDAQEHRYAVLAEIAKIPTEAGLVALTIAILRACYRWPRRAWATSRTSAANYSS